MNNKPQSRNSRGGQNWGEVQLAIAAIALTATLAFWNLFSAPQKQQDVAQAPNDTPAPPQELAQDTTSTSGFLPVKIIFGGAAPQQKVVVQSSAAPATRTRQKPQPHGRTGSSKP